MPAFADREDQVFYEFCMQVLRDHFVDDEVFAEALDLFGEAGLVDTIGCLGNFSMLAMCLNTFQVDLQQDRYSAVPRHPGLRPVADARVDRASRPSESDLALARRLAGGSVPRTSPSRRHAVG